MKVRYKITAAFVLLTITVLAGLGYVLWVGVRKQQEKPAEAAVAEEAAAAAEEAPEEFTVMLDKKRATALATLVSVCSSPPLAHGKARPRASADNTQGRFHARSEVGIPFRSAGLINMRRFPYLTGADGDRAAGGGMPKRFRSRRDETTRTASRIGGS